MSRLKPSLQDTDHVLGERGAGVVLVEYGDFECPHCGEAHAVVQQLLHELGTALAYVFRHFPLTQMHPHALQAAEAAETAGALGNFWGMHDLLMTHQDQLTYPDFLRYAQDLRLEGAEFDRQLRRHTHVGRIREQMASGVRSGVNGTPSWFINDERYEGPAEVHALADAVGRVARI